MLPALVWGCADDDGTAIYRERDGVRKAIKMFRRNLQENSPLSGKQERKKAFFNRFN